ncbi:MAG: hypothetical protein ACI8QC_000146 [Planctomycetota bacterium]|jgi:hypothetical protein
MELHLAYHAKSPIEAQLVKGRLLAEGLHPVVPGEDLNDEFGMASKLAGTLAVQVLVPAHEASLAETALKAIGDPEED